jgi:hypothetical protein
VGEIKLLFHPHNQSKISDSEPIPKLIVQAIGTPEGCPKDPHCGLAKLSFDFADFTKVLFFILTKFIESYNNISFSDAAPKFTKHTVPMGEPYVPHCGFATFSLDLTDFTNVLFFMVVSD